LVESFRLPRIPFKPKILPTRDELVQSYKMLSNIRDKALFLFFASTGLRRGEVLSLQLKDLDFSRHMVVPSQDSSTTKHRWASFWNEETDEVLRQYLSSRDDGDSRVFPVVNLKIFRGNTVTPQVLREWFCCQMGALGVGDRYIDAFCGRIPRSILARHYTDYSPDRLKEIYDKTNLKVFT
jgi:integrase